jgi:hypothetical protein
VKQFAEWLSTTRLSVAVQEQYVWYIPAVQSIHIIAITMLVGSVLMITLRLLGSAGMDQTLRQTTNRFWPWMTTALYGLLITGLLLIIGEPVRELITFSFWLKMFLVAVGTVIAVMFRVSLRKHQQRWGEDLTGNRAVQSVAILSLLIWVLIIILGRLIAYDHVWGSWSPAEKA